MFLKETRGLTIIFWRSWWHQIERYLRTVQTIMQLLNFTDSTPDGSSSHYEDSNRSLFENCLSHFMSEIQTKVKYRKCAPCVIPHIYIYIHTNIHMCVCVYQHLTNSLAPVFEDASFWRRQFLKTPVFEDTPQISLQSEVVVMPMFGDWVIA